MSTTERSLGVNQQMALDALRRHGRWEAGGGWHLGNHSTTVKVLESLVKRGLVQKETLPSSRFAGQTYDVYTLAEEASEKDEEPLPSQMSDETLAYAFSVMVQDLTKASSAAKLREAAERIEIMWEELRARRIYLRKI